MGSKRLLVVFLFIMQPVTAQPFQPSGKAPLWNFTTYYAVHRSHWTGAEERALGREPGYTQEARQQEFLEKG
jgi:hypothetical protein